jgi:8-oxo-dGTP pyrophosphatase MutT (NUDIX family)
MNAIEVDPGLFRCKEKFLTLVTEKLGKHPSDFPSSMAQITISRRSIAPYRAAGVLVPLLFRESSPSRRFGDGQFVFQLIKRSSSVPQPGDLSCPGGMIHPIMDRLLQPLLTNGLLPIIRGPARIYLGHREPDPRRLMTLFLTNALRESWEEIGLSPFRVRFLGPLPAYSLILFRCTIFPLAGFVERPGLLHLNSEVEKIVEIPLTSFCRKDLFGCYSLTAPDNAEAGVPKTMQYPCMILRDADGVEEILWGATFHILVHFLNIITDYHIPEWKSGRVIQRTLQSDYRSGRSSS